MTNEHQATAPTPPDELVRQWRQQWNCRSHNLNPDLLHDFQQYLITQAAQWCWEQRAAATEAELQQRADQELEACLEHLSRRGFSDADILGLRAARRPKPLSKADQAIADLGALVADLSKHGMGFKTTNLRRALERLKELEGQGND